MLPLGFGPIQVGLGLVLLGLGLVLLGLGLVLLGLGLVLLGLGRFGLDLKRGGAEDSLRHIGDGLGRRGVSSPCNCHAWPMLSGLPGELDTKTGE